ncbi:Domain of unknown function DUF1786 putative pyruvate format-lyase activating enzyme [Methanohalobium evestigatum Z-7303]|uniref:Pyruvate formate-lyase activating enzyme n=1 Tax=Methanohalobium evestigatum (strain ATCC BAA-1072 / DSM 3721 / NBRC 107634 / OCM 161 / Z-7303) TaxID=644295 RepID=D7E866_METEZ|nr:DUF1786 family protein [Methanohalobium evestigatum]ADI73408.1 Domain of unknown function DUF1786 putative pyruvate format-lyase activating enzyme [Methanohalobium evestigatum Z-7303]
MQILSIDVGTGTQDILLYDTEKGMENSPVMIMPSPTVMVADKIRKATSQGIDIVLTGYIMGGGPSTKAVKDHLKKGLNVYATENAALTIHDNPDKIRSMGVKIIDEHELKSLPENLQRINLQDLTLDAIKNAYYQFGITAPSNFAVAVQDHGYSPESSNRVYRFKHFENAIREGGGIEQFSYKNKDIPPYLTRLVDTSRIIGGTQSVFMDTGPAAIFGSLKDSSSYQPSVVVNIGNGHTLGALVIDNKVVALFEHHTSQLTSYRLQDYIIRLSEGDLAFEEIFNDKGHGCYINRKIGFDNIKSVMVTGPRREMIQNLDEYDKHPKLWDKLHFAAPFGNMMLTGCFGLISAYCYHYG